MMQLISNNPYRILGILADATAREQNRQANRLKQYIKAEQELPQDDYSFPLLGQLNRTIETVIEAAAKLNLDADKMQAALFWFWKGKDITDEPAFDALKEGRVDEAYQIWDKLITETKEDGKKYWKEASKRNFSAFHNYCVIELLRKNGQPLNAVIANIKFIESDYFSEFVKSTVDITYKVSKKDIELKFLEVIVNEISDKKIPISLSQLVKCLNDYDFSAKDNFHKSISQKLTANITDRIETARKSRTTNKANAATAGENLYKNTKEDLVQLKEIFGIQDFTYSNTTDKVANEILQCSIDFFNDSQEKKLNNNYHGKALNLVKQAQMIAEGQVTKGRIEENMQIIEEMQFNALRVLKTIKQIYDTCQWDQTVNANKVIEIIKQTITPQDVNSIKSLTNATKVMEYKMLVNFVFGQLGSYYKSKVSYLDWWSTVASPTKTSTNPPEKIPHPIIVKEGTVTSPTKTSTSPTPSTSNSTHGNKNKWYNSNYFDFMDDYLPWIDEIVLPLRDLSNGTKESWIFRVDGWAWLLWPLWLIHAVYSIPIVLFYFVLLHIPLWIIYNIVRYIAKEMDN